MTLPRPLPFFRQGWELLVGEALWIGVHKLQSNFRLHHSWQRFQVMSEAQFDVFVLKDSQTVGTVMTKEIAATTTQQPWDIHRDLISESRDVNHWWSRSVSKISGYEFSIVYPASQLPSLVAFKCCWGRLWEFSQGPAASTGLRLVRKWQCSFAELTARMLGWFAETGTSWWIAMLQRSSLRSWTTELPKDPKLIDVSTYAKGFDFHHNLAVWIKDQHSQCHISLQVILSRYIQVASDFWDFFFTPSEDLVTHLAWPALAGSPAPQAMLVWMRTYSDFSSW